MPRAKTATVPIAAETWVTQAACARPENREVFWGLSVRAGGPRGEQARTICAHCPVLAECGDYATREQPTAGMWAGHNYTRDFW
jgi:WhiB family redox-sensing transcriptional regulator